MKKLTVFLCVMLAVVGMTLGLTACGDNQPVSTPVSYYSVTDELIETLDMVSPSDEEILAAAPDVTVGYEWVISRTDSAITVNQRIRQYTLNWSIDNAQMAVTAGEDPIESGARLEYGSEVTLIARAATGYENLSVTLNGTAQTLVAGGRLTFTVTADTTIVVTAQLITYEMSATVQTGESTASTNGSVRFLSNNEPISGDRAGYGSTVVVEAVAEDGYMVKELTVIVSSRRYDVEGENGVFRYEVSSVASEISAVATIVEASKITGNIATPQNVTMTSDEIDFAAASNEIVTINSDFTYTIVAEKNTAVDVTFYCESYAATYSATEAVDATADLTLAIEEFAPQSDDNWEFENNPDSVHTVVTGDGELEITAEPGDTASSTVGYIVSPYTGEAISSDNWTIAFTLASLDKNYFAVVVGRNLMLEVENGAVRFLTLYGTPAAGYQPVWAQSALIATIDVAVGDAFALIRNGDWLYLVKNENVCILTINARTELEKDIHNADGSYPSALYTDYETGLFGLATRDEKSVKYDNVRCVYGARVINASFGSSINKSIRLSATDGDVDVVGGTENLVAGQTITITTMPDANKMLYSLTINGQPLDGYTYTLPFGEDEITIAATFTDIVKISGTIVPPQSVTADDIVLSGRSAENTVLNADLTFEISAAEGSSVSVEFRNGLYAYTYQSATAAAQTEITGNMAIALPVVKEWIASLDFMLSPPLEYTAGEGSVNLVNMGNHSQDYYVAENGEAVSDTHWYIETTVSSVPASGDYRIEFSIGEHLHLSLGVFGGNIYTKIIRTTDPWIATNDLTYSDGSTSAVGPTAGEKFTCIRLDSWIYVYRGDNAFLALDINALDFVNIWLGTPDQIKTAFASGNFGLASFKDGEITASGISYTATAYTYGTEFVNSYIEHKDLKKEVTITLASGGSVVVDKSIVMKGETVTLTVTPDSGYGLTKLLIDGVNNLNTRTIVVNEDATITAEFALLATVTGTLDHSLEDSAIKYSAPEGATVTIDGKNFTIVAPSAARTRVVFYSGCVWGEYYSDSLADASGETITLEEKAVVPHNLVIDSNSGALSVTHDGGYIGISGYTDGNRGNAHVYAYMAEGGEKITSTYWALTTTVTQAADDPTPIVSFAIGNKLRLEAKNSGIMLLYWGPWGPEDKWSWTESKIADGATISTGDIFTVARTGDTLSLWINGTLRLDKYTLPTETVFSNTAVFDGSFGVSTRTWNREFGYIEYVYGETLTNAYIAKVGVSTFITDFTENVTVSYRGGGVTFSDVRDNGSHAYAYISENGKKVVSPNWALSTKFTYSTTNWYDMCLAIAIGERLRLEIDNTGAISVLYWGPSLIGNSGWDWMPQSIAGGGSIVLSSNSVLTVTKQGNVLSLYHNGARVFEKDITLAANLTADNGFTAENKATTFSATFNGTFGVATRVAARAFTDISYAYGYTETVNFLNGLRSFKTVSNIVSDLDGGVTMTLQNGDITFSGTNDGSTHGYAYISENGEDKVTATNWALSSKFTYSTDPWNTACVAFAIGSKLRLEINNVGAISLLYWGSSLIGTEGWTWITETILGNGSITLTSDSVLTVVKQDKVLSLYHNGARVFAKDITDAANLTSGDNTAAEKATTFGTAFDGTFGVATRVTDRTFSSITYATGEDVATFISGFTTA